MDGGRTGMRALLVSLLTIAALGTAGCAIEDAIDGAPIQTDETGGHNEPQGLKYGSAPPVQQDVEPGDSERAEADAGSSLSDERLVVRTTRMSLRVEDVGESVSRLRGLTDEHGGIIESLHISEDGHRPVYREEGIGDRPVSAWLTLRIPVASLDAFVDEAVDIGEVLSQSEDARDVTQQHVDLEARLENLRAQEGRLREMFERADTVEDMLAVERELSRVRGDAEAMQARIDDLEKQAAMATVALDLLGPEQIVRPAGTDWGFVDALTRGIRAFVGTVNVMIVVTLGLAPLLGVTAIAFALVWALVRRRRRRSLPAQGIDEVGGDRSAGGGGEDA